MNKMNIFVVNSKLIGGGQDRLNPYNISVYMNITIDKISSNR